MTKPPMNAGLPDGLKFVYAIVALLSEGRYDVIISAQNREIEMENLRSLRAELPAVWSDISNAMRGFKDHSLQMLVLDEVLGLELSNFSRQLKSNQWLHLAPRLAALGADAFEQGPVRIRKIHAYLVKEVNLA